MKILFFSDYYSTWNIGGGSRVLSTQLEVCEASPEIEYSLISGYPGLEEKEHTHFNWIKYPYKQAGFLFNLWFATKSYSNENKVDILHIHQPLIGLIAHLLMPKEIPRLYHFHSFWKEEKDMHAGGQTLKRLLNEFKGGLENWVLSKMKHFIVLSEFSKNKLLKTLPEAKISVIPGSIRISKDEPLRQLSNDSLRLLSVRRLEPRMGLDLLIKAVAELKDKKIDVQLDIVGEGRERSNLESLIKELNLETQVHLLGRLSEKDLETQLLTHHGMVVPTRSLEGFGMTVIEAFERGMPVLATKVGGLKEFEKHLGAFYSVEEPEVKDLVDGILSVKEPWFRVDERTKACRSVAKNYYSHSKMGEQLTDLYRELL